MLQFTLLLCNRKLCILEESYIIPIRGGLFHSLLDIRGTEFAKKRFPHKAAGVLGKRFLDIQRRAPTTNMNQEVPKVYLDNCCYNRPYDDQSQLVVSLEAQAKLQIQGMIRDGKIKLAISYVLQYENGNNPFANRKNAIEKFFSYACEFVDDSKKDEIIALAKKNMEKGLKFMDACHVACAEISKCDYFLTTDKRLLKHQSQIVKILNPIGFLQAIAGGQDG